MAGKRIAVFSLLTLVALALALFATSGTHAQTYKPTFGYTVATPTHDTASTTINIIDILAPEYNYEDSSMYTFTPIDESQVTGPEVAIADGMGDLDAISTTGLLGGPCFQGLHPIFDMENASIDTSDVLGPADMYWILKNKDDFPVPYDKYDPNIPDYLEAMPHFINEMLDPDGDGPLPPLQPRARYVGYSDIVSEMNIIVQIVVLNPGQLTELGGIKAQLGPALGYPSLVVLNNPVSSEEAPGKISDFCTPLNTITTLLATTLPNVYTSTGGGTVARHNPPEDSGVLGSGTHMARNYSMSERDVDGDGIENDLDPCPYNDDTGWDPRIAGIQPGFDSDGDHLPDTCDPNPGIPNTDEDGDGYDNGQDICPLVPNGCTDIICAPVFPHNFNPAWDNQADDDNQQPNADLGPNPDSIGNACDDSDNDGTETGASVAPGAGNCTDGTDNDDDGLVDMLDPDCTGYEDAGNPVAGSCWDNVDNDSTDGTDWADSTCIATAIHLDNGELKYGTDPWGTNPGSGQFYHALPWAAVTINAAVDTDGDGYSDSLEGTLGSDPNDSDKTPESYVIDATITVGAGSPPQSGGLPSLDVPQSCNDLVDNDGDTDIDGDDAGCTCPTGTDGDCDGVADGSDNCSSDWNPEQTNTDVDLADGGASFGGVPLTGDAEGDACDDDDDNDGYTDADEWYFGTDPLDNCTNVVGKHAAWPLDINMDQIVTVSFDVLPYRGNIQVKVDSNPPTSWSLRRLDLNGDGIITVSFDVLPFRGNIQKTCT